MAEPAPSSPSDGLNPDERDLLEHFGKAAPLSSTVLPPTDRDLVAAALAELGDRRRLGAFYGVKKLGERLETTAAAIGTATPPEPEPTLDDARDAIRRDIVGIAVGSVCVDGYGDELDHLTAALWRLERLARLDELRAPKDTEHDAELGALRDVATVARDVINTVREDLEREHFVGRFVRLYNELERLSAALENAGR